MARVVLGVVHDVGRVGGGRDLEAGDEARDEAGAAGLGAVAEEGVEYFAAEHGDELVGLESFAEIDGEFRGGEDPHAGDVAIDEAGGDVELVEHAERDGSAAGLGARGASLEEKALDSAGG